MSDSYYGQPVIKEPIWTWEIPCYFFAGGLAGAPAGIPCVGERRCEGRVAAPSLPPRHAGGGPAPPSAGRGPGRGSHHDGGEGRPPGNPRRAVPLGHARTPRAPGQGAHRRGGRGRGGRRPPL